MHLQPTARIIQLAPDTELCGHQIVEGTLVPVYMCINLVLDGLVHLDWFWPVQASIEAPPTWSHLVSACWRTKYTVHRVFLIPLAVCLLMHQVHCTPGFPDPIGCLLADAPSTLYTGFLIPLAVCLLTHQVHCTLGFPTCLTRNLQVCLCTVYHTMKVECLPAPSHTTSPPK